MRKLAIFNFYCHSCGGGIGGIDLPSVPPEPARVRKEANHDA
jgi:hypothetical protein